MARRLFLLLFLSIFFSTDFVGPGSLCAMKRKRGYFFSDEDEDNRDYKRRKFSSPYSSLSPYSPSVHSSPQPPARTVSKSLSTQGVGLDFKLTLEDDDDFEMDDDSLEIIGDESGMEMEDEEDDWSLERFKREFLPKREKLLAGEREKGDKKKGIKAGGA